MTNRFNIEEDTPFEATKTGIALNTIKGLPKAGFEVGRDIFQSIARNVASTGLSLGASKFTGSDRIEKPQTGIEKSLFNLLYGNEPVENLTQRTLTAESKIQQSPFAKETGLNRFATPLAVLGVTGSAALDLFPPTSGREGLIKTLAKETDEGIIRGLLKKELNMADDEAKRLGPILAASTREKDVANLLDNSFNRFSSVPKTMDDFNRLSFDEQDKVFAKMAPALQNEILGVEDNIKSPIQEFAREIINTRKISAPGTDITTEAMENLGRGRYMSVFRRQGASSLDELADEFRRSTGNDITTSDLLEAIRKEFDDKIRPPRASSVSRIAKEVLDREQQVVPNKMRPAPTIGESINSLPPIEQSSLKPIIQNAARTPRDKVNIFDYFATPEYVLKKVGLENESKILRNAYDAYRKELPKNIDQITKWFNEVKDIPNAEKNIFKFLDGDTSINLSSKEMKVADEVRDSLKDWANRLGLPEDNRIASYITHIFDPDFIKKEFDPELAKIITGKIPGSVYNPFLEKRLGKMGYIEDVFAALDAYVKRGTRKVHMDPALEALKSGASKLDIETYNYVQRLGSRINLRPTEIDNLVDNAIKSIFGYKFGVRPLAMMSQKFRQVIYRGTLGLNIGSAVRNLTQGINTYSKLGEKYTIIGYTKLLSRMAVGNLKELTDVGVLNDVLIQDRKIGVYKSMLQKMDTGLFVLFDLAEKINRGSAYFGAKAKYIADGMNESDAIDAAKALVRETQFAFGNIDTPVALGSDIVKTIAQLQTYNVKQIEFLTRMAKEKDFKGIIRFIGASIVVLGTVGKVLGMKPENLIPTVNIGGSPFGSLLDTTTGLLSPDQRKRDEAKAGVGKDLFMLIPGGSQIRKTIKGLRSYEQGKSTTPTGRTRFDIPQTRENLFRSAVFGESTLPQAQEYYDKLNNKKSSTKTVGNRFNI